MKWFNTKQYVLGYSRSKFIANFTVETLETFLPKCETVYFLFTNFGCAPTWRKFWVRRCSKHVVIYQPNLTQNIT